ncbi:hypothetical protein DFH06DRAFT_1139046 [Mycena polygramma]|nr:hypothetical protein DFH06DRAFT_1139046 [Mycena polygramma]
MWSTHKSDFVAGRLFSHVNKVRLVRFWVRQNCRTEPILRFGVREIWKRTAPNRTPATLTGSVDCDCRVSAGNGLAAAALEKVEVENKSGNASGPSGRQYPTARGRRQDTCLYPQNQTTRRPTTHERQINGSARSGVAEVTAFDAAEVAAETVGRTRGSNYEFRFRLRLQPVAQTSVFDRVFTRAEISLFPVVPYDTSSTGTTVEVPGVPAPEMQFGTLKCYENTITFGLCLLCMTFCYVGIRRLQDFSWTGEGKDLNSGIPEAQTWWVRTDFGITFLVEGLLLLEWAWWRVQGDKGLGNLGGTLRAAKTAKRLLLEVAKRSLKAVSGEVVRLTDCAEEGEETVASNDNSRIAKWLTFGCVVGANKELDKDGGTWMGQCKRYRNFASRSLQAIDFYIARDRGKRGYGGLST